MNKDQQEIFFNKLEETLKNHQDSYQQGAWEEFDLIRNQRSRRWPVYWWAAAAVLLFTCSLIFNSLNLQLKNNENLMAKNKFQFSTPKNTDTIELSFDKKLKINDNKKVFSAIKENKEVEILKNGNPRVDFLNLVSTEFDSVDRKNSVQVAIPSYSYTNGNKFSSSLIDTTIKVQQKRVPADIPVLAGAYDHLTNHQDLIMEKPAKFAYGLVLSPAIGQEKLSFGVGVELSYPLGSNLSINSGVSYSSLYSTSTHTNNLTGISQSRDVSLSVSGIELPLGLEFRNHSGYYASAGVSALGLINDKLTYSFFEQRIISQTTVIAGQETEIFRVVSEKKEENSKETLNNFIGFYNFSIGKKQKIGNVNLNIGPFLKVPFNSISSEKINFLQGGIKVGITF